MALLRQCLFEVRQRSGEELAYNGALASLCDDPWYLGGHQEPLLALDEARLPHSAKGDGTRQAMPDD